MSKFDRKKIAVTLAFASLLGSKTSAMNTIKMEQNPASLGGAASQATNRNVPNNNKLGLGLGIGGSLLLTGGVLATIVGVKKYKYYHPNVEVKKSVTERLMGTLSFYGQKEIFEVLDANKELFSKIVEPSENNSEDMQAVIDVGKKLGSNFANSIPDVLNLIVMGYDIPKELENGEKAFAILFARGYFEILDKYFKSNNFDGDLVEGAKFKLTADGIRFETNDGYDVVTVNDDDSVTFDARSSNIKMKFTVKKPVVNPKK